MAGFVGCHLKRGDKVTGWRETYSLRIWGLNLDVHALGRLQAKLHGISELMKNFTWNIQVLLYCECVLNHPFQVSLGVYEQA
jgi:hypothetical protein